MLTADDAETKLSTDYIRADLNTWRKVGHGEFMKEMLFEKNR
jgi:hypothetical protein